MDRPRDQSGNTAKSGTKENTDDDTQKAAKISRSCHEKRGHVKFDIDWAY